MAAPLLGHIEEFDRRKGDWPMRLENIFAANNIAEADRKCAVCDRRASVEESTCPSQAKEEVFQIAGGKTYRTLQSTTFGDH